MDAPTGEQPMDVLGATNTLHRVSTEHLLPHRPAVTCVFPSARAREPFYATFSFVSRCHAASVCVWVAPARDAYTCTYVQYAPPSISLLLLLLLLIRSSIRMTTTAAAATRARTPSVNSARLFYSRLFESSSTVLRSRFASSVVVISPLFYSPVSHLCFPFLRLSHRFARNSARTFPSLVVLVADDTPSRTFAHFSTFIARAAGLQRNMRAREPNERAPVTVRVYRFPSTFPRFFVYAGMLIEKYRSGRDSLAFSGKR